MLPLATERRECGKFGEHLTWSLCLESEESKWLQRTRADEIGRPYR
jgi:hypothetical protein